MCGRGGYQPPAIPAAPVGRHALMPPLLPGRFAVGSMRTSTPTRRTEKLHRTRRGGSPSRPSAYGRLRGRVDEDIDPYRVYPNTRRTRRAACPHAAAPTRPLRGRVDEDIDPYRVHPNSRRTRRAACPHAAAPTRPFRGRVDEDIDPYRVYLKSHRTCRGGYQPPACAGRVCTLDTLLF